MTPQENQPGEAKPYHPQDVLGQHWVYLKVDYDREHANSAFAIAEYKARLEGSEFQLAAERQARILAGHAITIGDEALAAERAKRMELEGELRQSRDEIHRLLEDQNWPRCEGCCAELSMCGGQNPDGEPSLDCKYCELRDRLSKAEAELLALRGGKVGQPDLVRSEVIADGESQPTSTLDYEGFGREFIEHCQREQFFWDAEASEEICEIGLKHGIVNREKYDLEKHGEIEDAEPGQEVWIWTDTNPMRSIRGLHAEGTAKDSVQSESEAPSPEPAAIPKTTSARKPSEVRDFLSHYKANREWWIVIHKRGGSTSFDTEQSARFYLTNVEEVVHVREVGEGSRVSANALELLRKDEKYHWEAASITPKSNIADYHRTKAMLYRELLCVLSEEGGRQKEGGTELTSDGKS